MSDREQARSASSPRSVGAVDPRPSQVPVAESPAPAGTAHAHGQGGSASSRDLGFELPAPTKFSSGRAWLSLVGGLVLLGAAFAFGYLPRQRAREALAGTTHSAADAPTRVDTVMPKRLEDARSTLLPATVQPLNVTVLYARAQGYVRNYYVDLGDRVKEGQKLAEIETPEIDQQLDQARAELLVAEARLTQANASRDLANTSLARYKALRPAGVASQQELEQRGAQALVDEANVKAAEAAIAVQRANLRRLAQLKAFANVLAPFDGMITARSAEPGALVSANNATPLFELTATDPVRVFVQVPQDLAPSVRVHSQAKLLMREYPERVFEGEITRAAGALDTATRTMRTEVRVPNHDGALLTGMYGQVSLPLSRPHPVFELPATAVISDARGQRVAVVGDDGVVHLRSVVIERDSGGTIQLASGVQASDRVVKFANSSLSEGQRVGTSAANQ